jgi:AcrR family transcriptional regulator
MDCLVQERDTKTRILDAAEALLVEHGAERMSLRQITARADVNLAAVNYHFGGRQALIHAVVARHLDPLHAHRLQALDECERQGGAPDCAQVLAALFAPALHRSRAHPGFLRFLGRIYTDGDPDIASFLHDRYEAVNARFSAAFAAALPLLPPEELKLRLQFVLKAVAGVIAGIDLPNLLIEIGQQRPRGSALSDADLLARLTAMMTGALTAPVPTSRHNKAEILAILDETKAQGVLSC